MNLTREEHIQASCVQWLQVHGYTVLQTSRRGVRCTCGKKAYGGDGASKGVPDLLVTRKEWYIGMWLGIEIKGPQTKLSDEQRELHDQGRIVIIRSLDQLMQVFTPFQEPVNPMTPVKPKPVNANWRRAT